MIAIHNRPGSFSDKWIEYCEQNKVSYELIDCFASDIIKQTKSISGLMWHWAHHDHKAALFARQLTYSLEMMGKHVFPNSRTCWHYDDKVGQKYLLEAIGAPLVPSYVFYDKNQALDWAKTVAYPKVFKLRGGAGSANVKLVRDVAEANQLINQSFGKGFKYMNRMHLFRERFWHLKRDKSLRSLLNISKGIGRLFIPTAGELNFPAQRGYAYFQDFISDNDHDIRIIIIGQRAFAIKRMVREGDFRASGSGQIKYEQNQIPKACLELAFLLSQKIQTQCMAYDFVFCKNIPLLVECSYAFNQKGYLSCRGYWNAKIEWIEGPFSPEFFMVEDFLKLIETKGGL